MRALATASLTALSLGLLPLAACEAPADGRAQALAQCNAETLKLYPDPTRVPDEHVFRADCMRAQGYVLRQGEPRCNGKMSAQREATCYERVS
jgi:hypothetical protein